MGNKYSYIIYGQKSTIKLMMKTPAYSNVVDLITVPENSKGIVASLSIKHAFTILSIRNGDCWSFAVSQIDEETPIPPNWIISVQQSYINSCSTSIKITTPQAILFHSEVYDERTNRR